MLKRVASGISPHEILIREQVSGPAVTFAGTGG